ncbi:hypothetical protein ES705_18810 [subsurface metagenome]
MQSEEKMIYPIFRVFESAKPERGRKLNIDPTHDFDPYNDSLMDYASIIGHKLKKPWQKFNRLISVHVPLCPNDCWHCYVPKNLYIESEKHYDELTAKEIVDHFLDQRDVDKHQGKDSNVLRVTGGEPFLIPQLILECLEIIKEKGREEKIFLWTETNLEPFIGKDGKAFMDQDNNKDILQKLNGFENFVVHPCFHGLTTEEFNVITGKKYSVTLDQQVKGLKRLIEAKIDVYPTFGSNVCNPSKIKEFFEELKKLRHNLPLRVALIEYRCDYEPVEKRLKESGRTPPLYSRFASLRIWNHLLLKEYGVGYGVLPRHWVSLDSKKALPTIQDTSDSSICHETEVVYLFKGSYRDLYHRELLDLLALPFDHMIKIEYEKRWVQEDLFFHMSQLAKRYKGREGFWFYVDQENKTILPLRKFKIFKVSGAGKIISMTLKLRGYISFPDVKDDTLAKLLTQVMSNYFGSKTLPPGGKYVLLGESFLKDQVSSASPPRKVELSQAFNSFKEKANLCYDRATFHKIIPHLILNKTMKQSVFYRVVPEGLTKLSEGSGEYKKYGEDDHTIYTIDAGKSFNIRVDFFLPNYKEFNEREPEQRTIYFQSSSPTIVPIGPTKFVCSKYGEEVLRFRSEKITKEEEIALTFWSKHDEFRAAKVILHILVKPTHARNALFLTGASLLLALGTGGFVLLSQTIKTGGNIWTSLTSLIRGLFCYPDIVYTVLYLMCLSIIFYFLFFLKSMGFSGFFTHL